MNLLSACTFVTDVLTVEPLVIVLVCEILSPIKLYVQSHGQVVKDAV